MTAPTKQLTDAGVSIWLDDLSRERLTTGSLAKLIGTHHVSGVTTNPSIFAGALADGEADDLAALAADAGWADHSHFSRDFRDVIGVSPGEYRERFRVAE